MKVYLPNDIWYYIGDYLQPPEIWNIVWAGHIILKTYAIGRTKSILRSIVPICLTQECGKDINMEDIVCFYCFTHNITIHVFEHA